MEEPVFPDKSHAPKDADLAKVLGRTKGHWDTLRAHAVKASPVATPECKYYSKKSGWTFAVRGKRSSLIYLHPLDKRFTAGFVFGKKAVEAAEQSDLPDHIIKLIREAPQYPEGRGVRLEVKTLADVEAVKKLLSIKMEN